MRWDKTVTRIFLIFSVVNVALAAPAVIRPEHLDVPEDVTAASEKRADDNVGGHVAPDELPDPSGSSMPPGPLRPSSPPKHVTWYDGWVRPPESESDHSETLPEPVSGSDQFQSGPTSSDHDSESESSASPAQHDSPPESDSYRYFQRVIAGDARPPWLSPSISPHSESGLDEESATAGKFITDELKQKMKDYAVLGTVIGGSVGLLYGVQKEIMGTVSPGAETIGRDLASSDVFRRGAGTPLRLSDHILPRNDPVLLGLADMRDEDLRLLSVLTRRALESLD